ncbi:phosphopantetheine-binding protein [Stenotrophomonas sp. SAM-B]|jgi:aryl carrier-like protein|uniref:phosphopantetheine-binding protein n=1 Tax=unclassified Stenotrophomonas TaxID=196198 RepID=UPI0015A092FD|nr:MULTISPECIES: phosphopantetheine-binding protein [unclassified Stenotrophomonas]MDX3934021.1 phosphopantetheine-binding protein [Stenotrophomonas sp.]NWF32583.1 phosphopantetheine-binding protein [Stenotrophomonas sp. SAM-B]NYF35005.1 aryl carrier-like protein [Stenotrophomonas sp. JAI102]
MTALTLERMRADVAGMLGEAPEDIQDDENLMDLGLDSMRVLGLVLAWGNTGIPLEFSHLAEHATLGGWWTVVQRLQAEAAASA